MAMGNPNAKHMHHPSAHRTSIDAVKRINEAKGKFFFSKGAMQFFNSDVPHNEAFLTDDGKKYLFITSEQFKGSRGESAPRKYTVHSMDVASGETSGIGRFQQHDTYGSARRSLEKSLRWSCSKCGGRV